MARRERAGYERWVFATAENAALAVAKRSVEWLIGAIRRECLDHVVVFGENYLRYLLAGYCSCEHAP
jgi:hypothetical protein